MRRKYSRKTSGQTLLEILIAFSVAVILATAFVSLGSIAVRNSAFSQNQTRATQLAQEGMEAMITIRDQNAASAIQNNGTIDQWVKLFQAGAITSCAASDDLTINCSDFYLPETLCLVGTPQTLQHCMQRNTTAHTDNSWELTVSNAQFSRKVRITDTAQANVKNVTVFVWWTDSQGLHRSAITRKLHRDKLK